MCRNSEKVSYDSQSHTKQKVKIEIRVQKIINYFVFFPTQDICVMEDVIEVMEGLITKVVEGESRRDQTWCTVETPDNINVNPVRSKDDGVEVIILDDTLHKTFESPNEVNMQVDPLSIDTENVVIKKEPVTEMVDCKELVVHELYTEANLDDIDLAMEVVEEIVVEEVIVDDELDQTSNSENKANVIKDECEEQITEFKMLEASRDIRDVVGSAKIEANDKCPQLSNAKMESGGYNGNGEDVDEECEDDDDDNDGDDEDEYDGDDDDDGDDEEVEEEDDDEAEEEEEGKDIKSDDVRRESDVKLENKTLTTEQQPETEEMEAMIPQVAINRRSSQETTTTTTTTTTTETSTANSTSSSSDSEGDSSSSNEDSSKSSSNSDSDNASDSNSEEAEQAAETITRTTSTVLTDKKKSRVPSTAKREDVKKKDDGDDKLGGNYGMYDGTHITEYDRN